MFKFDADPCVRGNEDDRGESYLLFHCLGRSSPIRCRLDQRLVTGQQGRRNALLAGDERRWPRTFSDLRKPRPVIAFERMFAALPRPN